MNKPTEYLQTKKLLSYIRNGDYAHAGEEEAIDVAMQEFTKNSTRSILDVGCGLGGTANYLQQQGWGKVTGIDIEDDAIAYAKMQYPAIHFETCDVNNIARKFDKNHFDLILSFNAFFSFKDQLTALQALSKVAAANAQLVLFDYSSGPVTQENPFQGGSVQSFLPINTQTIEELLTKAEWQLIKIKDVTPQFILWYAQFLNKLKNIKKDAVEQFGENAFDRMYRNFSQAHQMLSQRKIEGTIVYAEKIR